MNPKPDRHLCQECLNSFLRMRPAPAVEDLDHPLTELFYRTAPRLPVIVQKMRQLMGQREALLHG